MAFMIPVVRKDMDVYGYGNRSRQGTGRPSSRGQASDSQSRSEGQSLSTSPKSINEVVGITSRKRSLAIEIRNQQHRLSAGSLPACFNSGHLSLPTSYSSPNYYRRPRSSTPRLTHSLSVRNSRRSEPVSPGKPELELGTSLPDSEGTSLPKGGSQNSLQKFHCRLLDRLRRSFRIHSDETATKDKGSRASS